MPWMAFAFLVGDVLFQYSPRLPYWQGLLPVLLLVILLALHQRLRGWLFLPLGWLWAAAFALWQEPAELPAAFLDKPVQTLVTIVRLPERRGEMTRLYAELKPTGMPAKAPVRVRLSWRDAPAVAVGQQWRLWVRLKPVHSYRNSGSWDHAGWLYRQGVRYRGYVTPADTKLLGQAACCLVERVRETVRERLAAVSMPEPGRALLNALVLGDRSGLDSGMREIAVATGVSHLLAISGLHISLVGGLAGLAMAWVWRRLPQGQRVPAVVAGAWVGLGAATLYALLSGFGLPARRALLMLLAAVVLLATRRVRRPRDVFSLVLLVVLLFEPGAVLDAGFWLSFVAVAVILALLPHIHGRPWWQGWILIQSGIAVGLYPVLIAFDMPMAPLGALVNLLLVPLFSLLLIPAALLTAVLFLLLPVLDLPLQWLGWALAEVWRGLEWAAVWQPGLNRPPADLATLASLTLAAVLLLSAPGLRSGAAALTLILAAHFPREPDLAVGEFRMDVLDVGQGLAAVIRTRAHVLVFDTGAAYPSGFNLADAVLLPWLRNQGVSRLDVLVLSHGDNDHAGAAGRLLQSMPAGQVFSGEPERVAPDSMLCPSGYYWRWDGVVLGFIQPAFAAEKRGNDASCMLLVRSPQGSVLLTGDAGKRLERRVVPMLAQGRPVHAIVAGHHGSATSSSAEFVAAVRAGHVVYSVGYRNRYGFPREKIDRRWATAGVRRWRTDGCGTISFRFPVGGRELPGPAVFAPPRRRYWHLSNAACEMTAPAPSSMMRNPKIRTE